MEETYTALFEAQLYQTTREGNQIQVKPQHQTSRNLSLQALLASAINASLKHRIKVMAVMAHVEYHTADPWRLSDHVLPPKQQLEGCKSTGQPKKWCKFNKMKLHKMLKMLGGHSLSRVSDLNFHIDPPQFVLFRNSIQKGKGSQDMFQEFNESPHPKTHI